MTVNRADTARLGSASPPRNRRSNNVGRPAGVIRTAVAINPVIAHPMLSRGNEVANRTNLLRCMSPELADIVAKVFLGWRSKILGAADALYARRREGPYRFVQNRPRTFVAALNSEAAERSRNQLSRDFQRRSIFDFCNSICQKLTSDGYSITSSARASNGSETASPSFPDIKRRWRGL